MADTQAPLIISAPAVVAPLLDQIEAREECGMTVLGPRGIRPERRVLYINSYGGKAIWEDIARGEAPTHHLWGCVELAAMGYEVALAEPLGYFSWRRRRIRQDLPLVAMARAWLGREGIVYAGHTILYWIPLLRRLRALKATVISQCFAREPLDHAKAHSGIIAMTPAAEEEARRRTPGVKVAHLGWGVDLDFFPRESPAGGDRFLACGIANRDFPTLAAATRLSARPIDVICPGLKSGLEWGSTVELYDGGEGWNIDRRKKFTFREILDRFYPPALASLVVIKPDPTEFTANGFTNILEGMAMGKAMIFTRTGAVPGEIDVEAKGCGLFVEPGNPVALAKAVETIAADPAAGRAMGMRGRELCEQHYNMGRFARELSTYFDTF